MPPVTGFDLCSSPLFSLFLPSSILILLILLLLNICCGGLLSLVHSLLVRFSALPLLFGLCLLASHSFLAIIGQYICSSSPTARDFLRFFRLTCIANAAMLARFFVGLLLACVSTVHAQTFTDCNPTKEDCPADAALGTNHTWVFNGTQDENIWATTNGKIDWTENGAEFSIKKKLDSPTLQSKFFIFFGIVESHVKMAKGGGIISSIVLQSDDLDEIDWEWVGYNTSQVQSNYFGKGNDSSFDRGGYHDVSNADTEFHNYTTYWTKEKVEWWLDQELVRTLKYEDALDGKNFPQTPSNVRFGIWPAGDSGNSLGTIEWAGGEVDYDKGPYTMVVDRVRVHDFSSGKEYKYTDNSGDWESIEVVEYVFTATVNSMHGANCH